MTGIAAAFHEGGRVMREPHMLSPALDAMPAQLILDPLGEPLTVDQREEPRPVGTAPVGAIAP